MKKMKKSIDPMTEARKNKKFSSYAKEASARIKLGAEIYKARIAKNLNQQELARLTKTTQKMISNLENGSVDVRYSTLNKIKEILDFQAENWSRIYDFSMPVKLLFVGGDFNKQKNKDKNNTLSLTNHIIL